MFYTQSIIFLEENDLLDIGGIFSIASSEHSWGCLARLICPGAGHPNGKNNRLDLIDGVY